VATVTITVSAVNDDPLTADDQLDTDEDATASINVLVNDVDVDGDSLSITAFDATTVQGSTVTCSDAGDCTYTPVLNFNGIDSFTYTASDGHGGSGTATVHVTVAPVNDNPVANDDAATTDEDTSIVISVLANDNDLDGDSLAVSSVTPGANGSVVINDDGTVTYTPNADFFGGDNFTYSISDGNGGTATATVHVTVTNVNDDPVANDDSPTVGEDSGANTIDVLANDNDGSDVGETLTVVVVTQGTHGSVAMNSTGTALSYTPEADYFGTDSFTYTISDGNGGIATAIVSVQIQNLMDLSGRVFDDKDNDGGYEPAEGDAGIGGVSVQLFDETTGALVATVATAAGGKYLFDVNLVSGTYKILAAQPAGFLDGRETPGNLGGTDDNTQDSHQIAGIRISGMTSDAIDYLFAKIRPSQGLGLVWSDGDNDGEVDFGERAIPGVAIELSGLDDRGQAVSRSATTDANGVYAFLDLRPSDSAGYTLRELQPFGYADGLENLGTVNGMTVGNNTVNDTFSGVVLPRPGSTAENYNFGERQVSEGGVSAGQTATIGFWQNKNGQNLINALNGGSTATNLGNWLAVTFSNMYGASAGANNLAGKDNFQVAAFYKTLFARTAQTAAGGGPAKMDAQVMATALAVYVTNQSLAGTTAAAYGFLVTDNGVGARTFNVGGNGSAFGVAINANVSVLDLLLAVNGRSKHGLLYDLDGDGDANDALETSNRTMANNVFSNINEAGDI